MTAPATPDAAPTIGDFVDITTIDPHLMGMNQERADELLTAIPARYAAAALSAPPVRAWVRELVRHACNTHRGYPTVTTGPSLLLTGAVGTGKTYEAYGAIRALGTSGLRCRWMMSTAADIYARLRPRHGVDAEAEFDRYANVALLVVDDLGAAKPTEWTEEVNYRLVNTRWEHEKPTLFTSNLKPRDLAERLGYRVMSRLAGMSQTVSLEGPDRRRPT